MNSPIEIIINAKSGAKDKEAVRQRLIGIFETKGVEARIVIAENGAEIVRLAKEAAQSRNQTIVAGGGDGTVAAVAREIFGAGKTLGVIPLGTFNFFARNLGIPLEVEDAARNLFEGQAAGVDVGQVNERIFLVSASLGLYPAVLRRREKIYRRWGRNRLSAYLSAALTMFRPTDFLKLQVSADGRLLRRKTPLFFVSKNKYQLNEFNIHGRQCLDDGAMAFFITHPVGRIGLLRLGARALFRRWVEGEGFQVLCLKEAQVESGHQQLQVAMDGEIFTMETPLSFRLRPQILPVIVPSILKSQVSSLKSETWDFSKKEADE